jgi:hypothetical protein
MEEENREKLRIETLLPIFKKSKTETADPNRVNERTDKLLPRCKKSITDAL